MTQASPADGLQDFSLQPEDNQKINLDTLSKEELLNLHAQIESRIGPTELGGVNLIRETLLQIHRAKELQEQAGKPMSGVPMNQRAQVQNSLANLLSTLAKTQAELYSSERIKRIQQAVVKIVKTLPKKQQDTFFEMLEAELVQAAEETDTVEVVK